jgi:uridylate kinase
MPNKRPRFRRILLKLSGEALTGEGSFGIDPTVLKRVAGEVRDLQKSGIELAVVVGGGNIFRGLNSSEYGIGRVQADHMGMLATVINGIALGEALMHMGSETRVMSAIEIHRITEPYVNARALSHLNDKRIVIFVAGTGNPYFSTDTAAALRAVEIQADVLLKATKVDGVFDSDPVNNPEAKPFARLSYREVLERNLGVMDLTAVSLAMGQGLPIVVFNLKRKGNIRRVVFGENVGSTISGEAS